MTYDFNQIHSRTGTDSVKWEYMPEVKGQLNEELLPLWIADMDFPCAEPIITALHKRVDQSIFGYSMPGSDSYLSSVQGWFKDRYGWNIEKNDIQISPGVVPAISLLIKSLTKPGDGSIIQNPVYYPFSEIIQNNGRTLVNNALEETTGYYSIQSNP